jgi:hypothetical protein
LVGPTTKFSKEKRLIFCAKACPEPVTGLFRGAWGRRPGATMRGRTGSSAGEEAFSDFLTATEIFFTETESRDAATDLNVSSTSSLLQENASAAAVRMTGSNLFFSLPR